MCVCLSRVFCRHSFYIVHISHNYSVLDAGDRSFFSCSSFRSISSSRVYSWFQRSAAWHLAPNVPLCVSSQISNNFSFDSHTDSRCRRWHTEDRLILDLNSPLASSPLAAHKDFSHECFTRSTPEEVVFFITVPPPPPRLSVHPPLRLHLLSGLVCLIRWGAANPRLVTRLSALYF